MRNHKQHLHKAIEIVGTQQKLAEKIGLSQQGISYLMNAADKVSAEIAIEVEKATDGVVSRHDLRPDIFGAKPSEVAA
jgi:DNA-binding transcriptional regulator YdaS (Cro superfamily)